jgi:hypothetical protein
LEALKENRNMTQGIYVSGRRPKSKKEVKELVLIGRADLVSLEATSIFGNEYSGPVDQAPDGYFFFVGPDPHTKRSFYGKISKHGPSIRVE